MNGVWLKWEGAAACLVQQESISISTPLFLICCGLYPECMYRNERKLTEEDVRTERQTKHADGRKQLRSQK